MQFIQNLSGYDRILKISYFLKNLLLRQVEHEPQVPINGRRGEVGIL